MTKRYGRNQKRRTKATIEHLQKALDCANFRAAHLEAEVARRNESIEEELSSRVLKNKGLYESAFRIMGQEMGRILGEKLYPIAERIFDSRARNSFIANIGRDYSVSRSKGHVIEARIQPISFQYPVWEEDES